MWTSWTYPQLNLSVDGLLNALLEMPDKSWLFELDIPFTITEDEVLETSEEDDDLVSEEDPVGEMETEESFQRKHGQKALREELLRPDGVTLSRQSLLVANNLAHMTKVVGFKSTVNGRIVRQYCSKGQFPYKAYPFLARTLIVSKHVNVRYCVLGIGLSGTPGSLIQRSFDVQFTNTLALYEGLEQQVKKTLLAEILDVMGPLHREVANPEKWAEALLKVIERNPTDDV